MRRSPPPTPFFPLRIPAAVIAAAAACLPLASCSARFRPVVALDEAFVATRPELSALLQDGPALRSGLFGLLAKPLSAPVALAEGAGKALDAANEERRLNGGNTALVTSPLVAEAIVEGGTWSGDPPLLVPEWRGRGAPGLWSATTDPVPAYRAAGSAAGSFIAALSKSKGGGSPSCALVYSEAPSRPRAALTAFAAAYAEASEGLPLRVRELGGNEASEAAPGAAPRVSAGGAAEAAVAELLGSDIRVLFVALGPDAGAAIRAAARTGLAIGADFPYPEAPRSLAFRIVPDDSALLRALVSELRELRGGARGGGARPVPALLVAGDRTGPIGAGRLDFRRFVEDAALRAKGPR
jgi:hypothetical protein